MAGALVRACGPSGAVQNTKRLRFGPKRLVHPAGWERLGVGRENLKSGRVKKWIIAIESFAFCRAPFPSVSISSPMGFRVSHFALTNPAFGYAVPESLYQTALLRRSKRSLMAIGHRSSCGALILGHSTADGRAEWKVVLPFAVARGHVTVDFGKIGNFQIFWRIDEINEFSR